jgi:hypothetical protein
MNEQFTDISLMNVLAAAVLLNDNKLEIPVEMAIAQYENLQLAITFNEDADLLVLELKEMNDDESGSTGE